jgi:hypothetical protein
LTLPLVPLALLVPVVLLALLVPVVLLALLVPVVLLALLVPVVPVDGLVGLKDVVFVVCGFVVAALDVFELVGAALDGGYVYGVVTFKHGMIVMLMPCVIVGHMSSTAHVSVMPDTSTTYT